MPAQWNEIYARRSRRLGSSVIREILKLTEQPDIISFAGGLPAPELFPIEEVAAATERVLSAQGMRALQYAVTEGYPPLREMIAQDMRDTWGMPCNVENILITSGSQQGLDLSGKILINPGDHVYTGEPTYLGMLQAFVLYEAKYVTIPLDEDGIQPDLLEAHLKQGAAKLLYDVPTFQNPSGLTVSYERRLTLVRLANEYNIPIIEDNPYGALRYEGEEQPPLVSIDCAYRGGGLDEGSVLYLGTFSKTLCPGFRIGWMIGPREAIKRMTQAKQGDDLHSSTLTQMIAYETAKDGFLEKHVAKLRAVYRERRDLMLNLMEELFPPGVDWTRPEGGLFTWVMLPENMDAVELLKKAVENKVAFVPGHAFYPNGGGENTFRMNFSNAQPEQIEEGIKRVAQVIKQEIAAQHEAH